MSTTTTVNRQFRLAARPVGLPAPDVWELVSEPVAEPEPGQVLVAVRYLSLDPAMRAWIDDRPSYLPPVGMGEVMRALGVGEVIASADERFAVGDHVTGLLGVQELAVAEADTLMKVDPALAPLPTYLGALGMTGMTAYFGLLDVGAAKAGDTVVVSGAAGAVGSIVGQIAKIKGCRVVGIAGGPEKCAWLVDELGFDAAIDYKSEQLPAALREHCPDAIDVFFDNVGGEILDAALTHLAHGARIVVCGAISQYNAEQAVRGPSNYLALLVSRARMEGFLVFDYADRYGTAVEEIAGWMQAGSLVAREDVTTGFEHFPERLLDLFSGANVGKLVLKV